MKVAHLTSVHPQHDIRIFHKQCKSLAAYGYDVYLIVKSEKDEVQDGIGILSIKERNNRLQRVFGSSREVYSRALASGAGIFHFHDPELIPVGILLALGGKKVVYDVHEDLPRQILSKPWIWFSVRYPVSWMASFAEWLGARWFFSAVVAATPTIAKRFPKKGTVTVQNFPILGELGPTSSTNYRERPENVVYVGGISRVRGVVENIRAFEFLKHKQCRFQLAGTFMENDLESKCRRLAGWRAVDYHGFLSRMGVSDLLKRARVGLVLLHPTMAYLDSLPIKLFEYMAAGIPVIASDFPLWREIIEGAGCGLLVDPMKSEEIAKAIDWILDNQGEAEEMGKNGRSAVVEQYNWANEEKKLIKLYEELAG